ncbi:hypothetical protein TNCV_445951 [Trichonephila clavipes]|nr:hypothetical protein TNCV_445951 [Trichonephila clavipes]
MNYVNKQNKGQTKAERASLLSGARHETNITPKKLSKVIDLNKPSSMTSPKRKRRCGLKWKITSRTDEILIRNSKINQSKTSTDLRRFLLDYGVKVSISTVPTQLYCGSYPLPPIQEAPKEFPRNYMIRFRRVGYSTNRFTMDSTCVLGTPSMLMFIRERTSLECFHFGYREASEHAGRRAVLLARLIVRSLPLEIVGIKGHEKVPTRGKPGLDRPGRPRGERIEGSSASTCGPHSDSFNDTSKRRRSNCSTNNFQTPCRSKSILNPSALSVPSLQHWNIGNCVYSDAKPDQC